MCKTGAQTWYGYRTLLQKISFSNIISTDSEFWGIPELTRIDRDYAPKIWRNKETGFVPGPKNWGYSVGAEGEEKAVLFGCEYVCAQLCLTLGHPMDYSLPGSSVHGISQARMLECIPIYSSRESSFPMGYCWEKYSGFLLSLVPQPPGSAFHHPDLKETSW